MKNKSFTIHDIIITILLFLVGFFLFIIIGEFELGLKAKGIVYPNISQIIIDCKILWCSILAILGTLFIGDMFWKALREQRNNILFISIVVLLLLSLLLFFGFAGAVFEFKPTILSPQ